MKAWVLPAAPIEPFGTELADSPWLRSTLGEGLRERLDAYDVQTGELTGDGPALIVGAELACNHELLRAFDEPGRAVLVANEFTDFVGFKGNVALPLWRVGPGAIPTSREGLDALASVEIDGDLKQFPFDDAFEIGVPRRFGLPVTDWSRLLWANLFGLAAEFVGASKSVGALFVMRTLLRARSLKPARIMAAASVIESSARVHPSAVVEASYIGPEAVVGPNAVVRASILCEGAQAEAQSNVTACVLAEGARAQRLSMIGFSVLWPGAFVGGWAQLSVFGKGSHFHGGSYAMDMNLDQSPVKIRIGSELVESGRTLGGCIGHDATIGSGVWLAPGRVIPNGVTVIRDPARIARKIPGDLDPGVVLCVRDGKLVPVEP